MNNYQHQVLGLKVEGSLIESRSLIDWLMILGSIMIMIDNDLDSVGNSNCDCDCAIMFKSWNQFGLNFIFQHWLGSM